MLDKGLSKAKTLAIKDFVKNEFLVSDGEDDPEADIGAPVVKKTFTTPNREEGHCHGYLQEALRGAEGTYQVLVNP